MLFISFLSVYSPMGAGPALWPLRQTRSYLPLVFLGIYPLLHLRLGLAGPYAFVVRESSVGRVCVRYALAFAC